MRTPAMTVVIALLAAGCASDACRRDPTYAYADMPLVPLPDNATLDAALDATGWRKMPAGPGAYATIALADGREVLLHLGIPEGRLANGEGLFIAAPDSRVTSEAASKALLEPAVAPLSRALGSGPVVYRGGVEHCGEV